MCAEMNIWQFIFQDDRETIYVSPPTRHKRYYTTNTMEDRMTLTYPMFCWLCYYGVLCLEIIALCVWEIHVAFHF